MPPSRCDNGHGGAAKAPAAADGMAGPAQARGRAPQGTAPALGAVAKRRRVDAGRKVGNTGIHVKAAPASEAVSLAVALFELGCSADDVEAAVAECSTVEEALDWLAGKRPSGEAAPGPAEAAEAKPVSATPPPAAASLDANDWWRQAAMRWSGIAATLRASVPPLLEVEGQAAAPAAPAVCPPAETELAARPSVGCGPVRLVVVDGRWTCEAAGPAEVPMNASEPVTGLPAEEQQAAGDVDPPPGTAGGSMCGATPKEDGPGGCSIDESGKAARGVSREDAEDPKRSRKDGNCRVPVARPLLAPGSLGASRTMPRSSRPPRSFAVRTCEDL